jgi:hypothetical protein
MGSTLDIERVISARRFVSVLALELGGKVLQWLAIQQGSKRPARA